MIASHSSIYIYSYSISVQGSIFKALWCGVLLSKESIINITSTKICNSTVIPPAGMHEHHLALVMLITSTLNLNNSTINNNTRRAIFINGQNVQYFDWQNQHFWKCWHFQCSSFCQNFYKHHRWKRVLKQ